MNVEIFLRDAEEKFLKRAEAAQYLRRSVGTLEQWAAKKTGPHFIRAHGRTLYPLAELQAWMREQPQGGRVPAQRV